MGNSHLSGSEKDKLLHYLMELLSTGTPIELVQVQQKIRTASQEALRKKKTRLGEALNRLVSAHIQVNPIAPINFKVNTRRAKAGLLLPYAYNVLDEFIDHESVAAAILELFQNVPLEEVKTESGKRIKVDKEETVNDIAQVIPGLVWWIPSKIDFDKISERPFEAIREELMYRIYKYHRLVDPVESYLERNFMNTQFDATELAENFVHDAKRGQISRGQLTNFLVELPVEISDSFLNSIRNAKNSPMFVSLDTLSMMAVDLASRIDERPEHLRPFLGVYTILLMSELFKEIPAYDDRSMGGTLFVKYEAAYVHVIGKALSEGLGAGLSDEELAEAASRLVSMELHIGKSRTDSMAGLTMGGFSKRSSFSRVRDIEKIQERYNEETV
jgi:hypothetical protein